MNENETTEPTAVETDELENAAEDAPTDALFNPPPEGAAEKTIAEYLEAHASDALREKIREAAKVGKGMAACYAYIEKMAREEAKGKQSVMIADGVVFGWAVHYFEDEWADEIERERKEAEEAAKRAEEAKADRAKWEAEIAKRKAEREEEERKSEEERLAAMTAEERAAYESAKARKEAEEAERKAAKEKADAAAAKAKAEREAKRKAAEERKRRIEEMEKAQMTFL